MEDQLRRLLNEKLDGLSVTDVAPAFNARQTWHELSPRLEKKERALVPVWWAYAASLMLGMLIGGSAIYYNLKNQPSAPLTAGDTKRNGVEPGVILRDADQAVKPQQSRAARTIPVANTQLQKGDRSLDQKNEPATETIVAPQAQQPVIADPQPETIAAATITAPKERAVHLLDVASEDKTAVVNELQTTSSGLSFTLYISPGRFSGGRDAQAPASVLHFIKK